MPDASDSAAAASILERAAQLQEDLRAFAQSAKIGIDSRAMSTSLRALRRDVDYVLTTLSDAEMTLEEARREVDMAMLSVDPNLATPSQWARAAARVEQRGNLFDVHIHYAGALFPQHEHAIRERLGHAVGVITRHE